MRNVREFARRADSAPATQAQGTCRSDGSTGAVPVFVLVAVLGYVSSVAFVKPAAGHLEASPLGPEPGPVTLLEWEEPDWDAMGIDAEFVDAVTPGPEHEWLAYFAGVWRAEGFMTSAPGAPEERMSGTFSAQYAIGGRVLVEQWDTAYLDGPLKVLSLMGFDRVQQRYYAYDFDAYRSGSLAKTGRADREAGTLTLTYVVPHPLEGGAGGRRIVDTRVIVDQDHFTSTSTEILADGTFDVRASWRFERISSPESNHVGDATERPQPIR